jgi:hypothetical protein
MRTNTQAVRNIIETTLTDAEINAYITGASILIDETLVVHGVANGLLEVIETWLTAHMIASTRERQTKKEEAGSAKVEYAGDFEMGLASTSYGQMVITLDPTGTLGGKKGIKFSAIKTIP